MSRLLLSLAFVLLLVLGLDAQSVSGIVLDAIDQQPIPSAIVRMQGQNRTALTDDAGRFTLTYEGEVGDLEVTRLGYRGATVGRNRLSQYGMVVKLNPAAALPDVVISAGAEQVLEDKTLHMYDYDFLDDQLVVILYDRVRRAPFLALVDVNDEILSRLDGPEAPGKLVRDCMGHLHVLGRRHACQLFRLDAERLGMYVDSLHLYKQFVEPCLGNIENYYYYSQERLNGQVLDYYHFDARTQKGEGFMQLIDRQKIHQMLDPLGPYVQYASTEASMAMLDEEAWDKINKLDYEMQFNRLAFFYPIHAPLHVIGQSLYVFDHTNLLIRRCDAGGKALDSVGITYPKLPHWQRTILIDAVREEAYTVFEQHGYLTLHEIDLKTGELMDAYPLPMQFPIKVQVRDGVVYYMYRELDYDDTNRLYRMRLKWE